MNLVSMHNFLQTTPHHTAMRNRDGNLSVCLVGRHSKRDPNDPNDLNGAHRLHIKACYGDLEGVRELLESKSVRIGIKERNSREAIHYAAYSGKCDMVKLLLEFRAKVTAEDESKMQPVCFAAAAGHVECVKLLLELRSKAEQRAKGNVHILHNTAGSGHLETLALLLDRRAQVDPVDSNGIKPIDLASNRNQKHCVRFLELITASRDCLVKASKQVKKGSHEAALPEFYRSRSLLVEAQQMWPGVLKKPQEEAVPHLMHETMLQVSSCELRAKKFKDCIESSQRLLNSFADMLSTEEVKHLAKCILDVPCLLSIWC